MTPLGDETPRPRPARESLERELLRLISGQLLDVPEGFDVGTDLATAGLDSMAIMQLLILIEDSYGLWLPEADLVRENFATVRALAVIVEQRLGEHRNGG